MVLGKKSMKWTATVMIGSMIALTGCGNGGNNAASSSGANKDTPKPAASTTAASDSNNTSNGSFNPDAKAEISFMGWGGDSEKAVFQKLVDSYMKKYPNKKVTYTVVPPGEYYQKLDTLIAAGKAPDVFYAGGSSFNKYVSSGILLDMQPYLKSSPTIDPNNVWKQGLDRYRFDGKNVGSGDLYGLPKDVGPWAFVYNKDLFDKAGLPYPSAKAGEYTWDDMLKAAQKLTTKAANGKTDVYGVGAYTLESAVWANGGDFIDYKTGKVTIDDPAFTDAMQFVADLNLKYHVSPSPDDEKAQNSYARFTAGKMAMFVMGPWDQPGFWKLPFKWDVAAWPASPKTGKTATWLGSLGFVASAKSKIPAEAFNLAAYFSVDKDAQKENMNLGQAVPNLMDMAKSDFLQMGKAPEHRQVFLDIIQDYGRPTLDTGSKDTKWLDTFWQDVSKVWSGQMSAADWAKQEQPKLQQLYDAGNKK